MHRRSHFNQALLRCLNPTHGRLLIYVWATEQDTLSKRVIPNASEGSQGDESGSRVQDVLVPWVHSASSTTNSQAELTQSDTRLNPKVFQRYYHLFGPSELSVLLCQAAKELGLQLGAAVPARVQPFPHDMERTKGMEIIQEGWERSNYYVEVCLWES
jgi:tRNA (uracil-5-)-methyltransferase TRM9